MRTRDLNLLQASETGPALESDQAYFADPAPLTPVGSFSILQVVVPHQSGYPARFLAVESSQVAGKQGYGIYTFVRSTARAPWLSDFNVFTDVGQTRPVFQVDKQGWAVPPSVSDFLFTPERVAQGYVAFLDQTWEPNKPGSLPFADGTYTSGYKHDDQTYLQAAVRAKEQATGSYRPDELSTVYLLTDGGEFVMSSVRHRLTVTASSGFCLAITGGDATGTPAGQYRSVSINELIQVGIRLPRRSSAPSVPSVLAGGGQWLRHTEADSSLC